MRRVKADVLSELPPVVERSELLDLTVAQKAAYREAIKTHARQRRSTSHLALFNQLRSICDLEQSSCQSSKLDRIAQLLEEIVLSGDKAVVFSHLLSPLRELERRLNASRFIEHFMLTGAMPLDSRELTLSGFKTVKGPAVLLASSRVGSEGLTLVEANHVFFVNRWWNPSANAQARDRVVRIGQRQTVFVWTFTCRGTVESRLDRILKTKETTFDELVEALALPGEGDRYQDLFVDLDEGEAV